MEAGVRMVLEWWDEDFPENNEPYSDAELIGMLILELDKVTKHRWSIDAYVDTEFGVWAAGTGVW